MAVLKSARGTRFIVKTVFRPSTVCLGKHSFLRKVEAKYTIFYVKTEKGPALYTAGPVQHKLHYGIPNKKIRKFRKMAIF